MLYLTVSLVKVVQVYETRLRYPFPKSFPLGKGLAIAALKYFKLNCFLYVVFDCLSGEGLAK